MENEEITLRNLFLVLWRGKWTIIITTILVLIIAVVGAYIHRQNNNQVTTILALEWDGIDEGKYPNNTSFNYYNIAETHIITSAIQESGLSVNTADIHAAINITPLYSKSVRTAIEKAIAAGENRTFYATQFQIDLNYSTAGLSLSEGKLLLSNLHEAFRNDFDIRFNKENKVADYTNIDFSEYEYVDTHHIFETQIQLIESAMNGKILSAADFRSSSGLTFADMLIKTDLVKRIEMQDISSRINNFALTKDKDYVISKYEYEIMMMELELEKARNRETNFKTLIDDYEGSTQVIIIPGTDPSQAFEIDPYYDKLYAQLIAAQNEVIRLQSEINFLELQIDRLNGVDPEFTVTPAKQAEEAVKVETMIEQTRLRFKNIIDEVNELIAEHNAVLISSVITPLMLPEYRSSVNFLLFGGVGLVLGFIGGCVIVFLRHSFKKEKIKQNSV
jgi:hypothetical protein